jgi:hypothetical protein
MSKTLKYQSLIDTQNLKVNCPDNGLETEITAYRLCFDPADSPNNFLPNIIEDSILNKPPRRLSGDLKHCEACGLSFFINLEGCINLLKHFPKLSHTHIARGLLEKNDGIKGDTNHAGHFVFFEYGSAALTSKFSIVYNR